MPAVEPHCPVVAEEAVLSRRSFTKTMRWDADLPESLLDPMWQDCRGMIASGQKLHEKLNCTLVRLAEPADSFVFKYQIAGKLPRRVRRSLSRTSASRSWMFGRDLSKAGIPTPRPRALLEHKVGPFQTACFLLSDYVPGTTLYRLLRYDNPQPADLKYLAAQVADIWQKLDDLGLSHNDFKTENLQVDPDNKVWLIDLDRMKGDRRPDRFRKQQTKDLSDFFHPRNWRSNPGAAEFFRAAIVQKPAAQRLSEDSPAARQMLTQPRPSVNHKKQHVTVLIPTRNAVKTIRACIESVRDIADEIVVADAGSSDGTLDVVREFGGCTIIERSDSDDLHFESWAQRYVKHPWTLRLLPDERLNPELGRQVQDTLAEEPAEEGFLIGRSLRFRGQRLDYGEFDRRKSVRLFRSDAGRLEWQEGRIEVVIPSGKTGYLLSRLVHEICPSVQQHLSDTMGRAFKEAKQEKVEGPLPPRQVKTWPIFWRFFRSYVLHSGWLDGRAGREACALFACTQYLHESAAQDFRLLNDDRNTQKSRLSTAA